MTSRPFHLHVDDAAIADLRDRLARTRLPDQAPDAPWAYGTDVGYLRDLIGYWRDGFDWRAEEARLNAFPQFKVPLHGIDVHYLHVPGVGPDPKPLLLLHGWPGSVFEFIDIIPRLTDPARFGGRAEDAFAVIAPSLPGYGLSFAPNQKRFSITEMADCFADLMTGVLGYQKFAVQGGDWGASAASALGVRHADKVVGIHINLLAIRPDQPLSVNLTPEENRYQEEVAVWSREETGYQWIQGTRPQTLAFGLSDSPAGLAAWIAEKFHVWTDNDGNLEMAVSRDRMLANISLYWFTGAIGSSFWPYYARLHGAWPIPDGRTVDVPTGYAAFPREIRRPPRLIAEKTYTDIRQWTVMAKGGHFAAMEQPEALASDVQNFFRPLRGGF
ncbi:MAG: epoxide hydrolase [Acetobacteraceae bacterium]|nr:epoxide hydrolase [Acetobacteraceae bacterium]